MKRKKIYILSILIIFIGIIFVLFNINFDTVSNNNILETKEKLYNPNDCKIIEEKFNVKGFSMEPMIKNGSEIILKLNYYNCNKNIPKSGDIVVFENPFTKEKVIKKLAVVPGDKIEIDNKDRKIKLNGEIFKNSANMDYVFTENELKWFNIYSENGKIKENIYFIFGDNIYNSTDSRDFGPITLEGLLGKVDFKK